MCQTAGDSGREIRVQTVSWLSTKLVKTKIEVVESAINVAMRCCPATALGDSNP